MIRPPNNLDPETLRYVARLCSQRDRDARARIDIGTSPSFVDWLKGQAFEAYGLARVLRNEARRSRRRRGDK